MKTDSGYHTRSLNWKSRIVSEPSGLIHSHRHQFLCCLCARSRPVGTQAIRRAARALAGLRRYAVPLGALVGERGAASRRKKSAILASLDFWKQFPGSGL